MNPSLTRRVSIKWHFKKMFLTYNEDPMRHFSCLALFIVPAITVGAEPTETITISASATVYVKPDSARVHYMVRASEPSVDAAKETVSKQVELMNEGIKGLKLADLTASVGPTAFSRNPLTARAAKAGFGAPAGPAQTTYHAQVPLTATIREKDPDKLLKSVDAFVKKIVESGAHITGDAVDTESPFTTARAALATGDAPRVEWFLSNELPSRQKAYQAAVQKAKADAVAISKELEWQTLKILSVVDGSGVRDTNEIVVVPSNKTPAGEVSVTARVTLKCSR